MSHIAYFPHVAGMEHVGFVSTDNQDSYNINNGGLWRTSDDGLTWARCTFDGSRDVRSFAFRDSLVGWIAFRGDGVAKTTDGGLTWSDVFSPGVGSNVSSVNYQASTHRLFLTSWSWGYYSDDEGATWSRWVLFRNGIAFSNDLIGIASWCGPNTGSLLHTTDGGVSWNEILLNSSEECWNPVSISNTKAFFMADDYGLNVSRSTDEGLSWSTVYAYPFSDWQQGSNLNSAGWTGGSFVDECGNVFVASRWHSLFVSADSGNSWIHIPDLPRTTKYDRELPRDSRFTVRNGFIYVASNRSNADDSLRGITTDLLQFDFRHLIDEVQLSYLLQHLSGTKRLVSVFVKIPHEVFGYDTVSFSLHFDPTLSITELILPNGWTLLDSTSQNGITTLRISSSQLVLDTELLRINFSTSLEKTSALFTLDTIQFHGPKWPCNYGENVSTAPPLAIHFNDCGDSLLLTLMRVGTLVHIDRIVPNPAAATLRVEGSGLTVEGLQVYDVMGRRVSVPVSSERTQNTTPQPPPLAEEGEFELDVRALPEGVYYLRAGQARARFEILR